jgi:hypothetical protein
VDLHRVIESGAIIVHRQLFFSERVFWYVECFIVIIERYWCSIYSVNWFPAKLHIWLKRVLLGHYWHRLGHGTHELRDFFSDEVVVLLVMAVLALVLGSIKVSDLLTVE